MSVFLGGISNELPGKPRYNAPLSHFLHLPPEPDDAARDTYPVMEKDECQQHIVDPCTDFCSRERLQDNLQGPHPLCNQVDPVCFHSAGQEAQKARVAQGFQVLPETKMSVRAPLRRLLQSRAQSCSLCRVFSWNSDSPSLLLTKHPANVLTQTAQRFIIH